MIDESLVAQLRELTTTDIQLPVYSGIQIFLLLFGHGYPPLLSLACQRLEDSAFVSWLKVIDKRFRPQNCPCSDIIRLRLSVVGNNDASQNHCGENTHGSAWLPRISTNAGRLLYDRLQPSSGNST